MGQNSFIGGERLDYDGVESYIESDQFGLHQLMTINSTSRQALEL